MSREPLAIRCGLRFGLSVVVGQRHFIHVHGADAGLGHRQQQHRHTDGAAGRESVSALIGSAVLHQNSNILIARCSFFSPLCFHRRVHPFIFSLKKYFCSPVEATCFFSFLFFRVEVKSSVLLFAARSSTFTLDSERMTFASLQVIRYQEVFYFERGSLYDPYACM